jgi:hypothetical protein
MLKHKVKKSQDSQEPFKHQVYCPKDIVEDIDAVCDKLGVYRSTFVFQAIKKSLETPKHQRLLKEAE